MVSFWMIKADKGILLLCICVYAYSLTVRWTGCSCWRVRRKTGCLPLKKSEWTAFSLAARSISSPLLPPACDTRWCRHFSGITLHWRFKTIRLNRNRMLKRNSNLASDKYAHLKLMFTFLDLAKYPREVINRAGCVIEFLASLQKRAVVTNGS